MSALQSTEFDVLPLVATPVTIRLDGRQLTLAQLVGVAVQAGESHYEYELTDEARVRMADSVAALRRLIAEGQAIYGVTTGFGDSANRQISPAKVDALQRNLLRYHRSGTGPLAPDDVVRATILIRANCAARGNSAIREEPIELLLNLLRHDILPMVPQRGSVGASGDLTPLAYIASALVGEGDVRCGGVEMSAAAALAEHGLQPVELQAKEGLALVNGTSFSTAYLVLAVAEATRLAAMAELCTAFVTEVRRGLADTFMPFPHEQRPHVGQITAARNIRRFLDGSKLAIFQANLANAAAASDGYAELNRHVQDPYSIRCAPHVIGVLRDTMEWVQRWMVTEINASTDNPLIDASNGAVHNSGNFYGGHVAQAAQALAAAAASVADLLDRQLQLVVDVKYSNGLPANLAAWPNGAEAGLHHGFKAAQLTASALTAEALQLTMPASSFSRSTESHNQDKVSMSAIAARHARTTVELSIEVAAIHLMALAQAAELRGVDELAPETRRSYLAIRKHVQFVAVDRALADDIKQMTTLIRSGEMEGDFDE